MTAMGLSVPSIVLLKSCEIFTSPPFLNPFPVRREDGNWKEVMAGYQRLCASGRLKWHTTPQKYAISVSAKSKNMLRNVHSHGGAVQN